MDPRKVARSDDRLRDEAIQNNLTANASRPWIASLRSQ